MEEPTKSKLRGQMLAEYCAALGNPTRILILEKLAARGEPVTEGIIEIEGITRFTVQQNLKYLKKYGFIQGSITGNFNYSLNYGNFQVFKNLLDNFLTRTLEHSFGR